MKIVADMPIKTPRAFSRGESLLKFRSISDRGKSFTEVLSPMDIDRVDVCVLVFVELVESVDEKLDIDVLAIGPVEDGSSEVGGENTEETYCTSSS
ncbi:hypothetical protein OGATHE_000973 [Ogataea polymorpha]|uniref:Uncharacterized protein n=1 Tax=Ogataea polymorpha TaxID=460523 RepID=A0A9P8PU90_9ASCO|nr:hypothetical protein OGATHE_000973 [Ogataea polymorpha]